MNSMLIQTVFTVLRDKTNMDDLMEEEKRQNNCKDIEKIRKSMAKRRSKSWKVVRNQGCSEHETEEHMQKFHYT